MFIDDVFTFNLRDPAGVPVTNYIDEAFDHEINAFVELSQDPDAAKALIETALSHIASAEHAISTGSFQSGTRSADALTELAAAKKFDEQALDEIAAGDTTKAGELSIEASTAKARAELFLDGHNPEPGPFPNGLGGFDDDDSDSIFADGFESGDVSAWSTGDPVDVAAPLGKCQPDDTTLCLQQGGRFKVETEWVDFIGHAGPGTVRARDEHSGTFEFNIPDQTALNVQVLDACDIDNHF